MTIIKKTEKKKTTTVRVYAPDLENFKKEFESTQKAVDFLALALRVLPKKELREMKKNVVMRSIK